jgi:hypothetical protein
LRLRGYRVSAKSCIVPAGFVVVGVGFPPSRYGRVSSSPAWILWIITRKSTDSAVMLELSNRETRPVFEATRDRWPRIEFRALREIPSGAQGEIVAAL